MNLTMDEEFFKKYGDRPRTIALDATANGKPFKIWVTLVEKPSRDAVLSLQSSQDRQRTLSDLRKEFDNAF